MILDSTTSSLDTKIKDSDHNIKNSKVKKFFPPILIKASPLNQSFQFRRESLFFQDFLYSIITLCLSFSCARVYFDYLLQNTKINLCASLKLAQLID